ncbi:MAG: 23S rRNA (adenine(2503)-C(2))-methyltransferase RlmN [Candidatus Korobacteraceae bacterium]
MTTLQHTELLGLSNQQLTKLVENFGQPSYRARQLLDGLYRQRWSALEQFSNLPKTFRQQLADSGYRPGLPEIEHKFVSVDGTVRYLLRFSDGQSVETVWMPEGDGGEAGDGSEVGDAELRDLEGCHPERSETALADERSRRSPITGTLARESNDWHRATICVSSQVGCAVDCAFCMTALLGLKRNLSPGEIIGQVLTVLNDRQVEIDRERINLVFMGQGEPFLNYDNFMQAVRLLAEEAGIPASRMTVSTSGIVPRIADFGEELVRPKLAVSLNAPSEELRTQIMPITKKWTIAKLIATLRDFPLRQRERLTFEYVLLSGVNDEPAHARELVDLVRGLRAKVNLIALNPGPELPFATPEPSRVAQFQNILIKAGIPAYVRRPRGRDIYAACGQLKHTTELIQLS